MHDTRRARTSSSVDLCPYEAGLFSDRLGYSGACTYYSDGYYIKTKDKSQDKYNEARCAGRYAPATAISPH